MKIADARVLLTGATGGIGAAIARRLYREGAELLLTGRDENALAALATEFGGPGDRVEALAADLARPEERRSLADHAASWRGGIDTVVHNAGTNASGLFEDLDAEAIDAIVAANITAPMQLTRLLLPSLQARERALLLFIGSGFGTIGYPGFTAYSASKFALRGFAEALRRELADSPVQVALLAPRAVDTGLNDARIRALQGAVHMAVDPPERIADRVVELIHKPRAEANVGWPERFFARLNRMAPSLVDGALRKQLPTIRAHLTSKRT